LVVETMLDGNSANAASGSGCPMDRRAGHTRRRPRTSSNRRHGSHVPWSAARPPRAAVARRLASPPPASRADASTAASGVRRPPGRGRRYQTIRTSSVRCHHHRAFPDYTNPGRAGSGGTWRRTGISCSTRTAWSSPRSAGRRQSGSIRA
jgi:hypothetical protein